jgi:hypothetical protein
VRALAAVILSLAAGAAAGEPAPQAALAAATALRGPLEGTWRLTTTGGRGLYLFELADPGASLDPRAAAPQRPAVEGAWRDLRRPGDRSASAVFDGIERSEGAVTLRFSEGGPVSVVLRRGADGSWRGWLTSRARTTHVVMERQGAQVAP